MPKSATRVIFIHGLAKKPAPDKLSELWIWGLGRGNPRPDVFKAPNAGIDLVNADATHALNYYADVFYGEDYETDLSSYYESAASEETPTEALGDETIPPPQNVTPEELAFVAQFEAKLAANMVAAPAAAAAESATKGVAPGDHEMARLIPAPAREAIIKKAAMEAYYFLFNKEYVRPKDGKRFHVRQELRSRLLEKLKAAKEEAEKIVVISHSMGTMVAYDVLRNCPDCPPVDTLITLGSPLGVREVQQEIKASGKKSVDFPAATLRRWINIYDPLDPICGADPKFTNDYEPVENKRVEDVKESNWGSWRHTLTHYLAGTTFRRLLRETLDA
jgi:hypothetical protein